jgi:hypothetical protein
MSDNTDLIPLNNENAVDYFKPEGLKPIIEKIRQQVAELTPDTSTAEGRAVIRSNARKVASAKTAIDQMGKDLVTPMKAQCKIIDAERSRAWDELEALQKTVRQPLDEWEEADKKRTDAHQKKLEEIGGILLVFSADSKALVNQYEKLIAYRDHDFEEFAELAKTAIDDAEKSLLEKIEAAKKQEAERAELENLRKQAAERAEADRLAQVKADEEKRLKEQKEREERLVKEAEERIQREAEEKQRLEAERLQREKTLADERARIAEENRIASEQRAEREKKEAAEKAERDRIAAAEKADRDKEEAVRLERQRQENERIAKAQEDAKREADTKHRKKINNEAVDSLLRAIVPADEETTKMQHELAKKIVEVIARGLVAHIKITY